MGRAEACEGKLREWVKEGVKMMGKGQRRDGCEGKMKGVGKVRMEREKMKEGW